jgi:hypothetical protein
MRYKYRYGIGGKNDEFAGDCGAEKLSCKVVVSKGYCYGFNGLRRSEGKKGSGDSLDFGPRVHDSRLGRWLSLDPLMAMYPNLSLNNFCTDNPVYCVEIAGRYLNGSQQALQLVQTLYSNICALATAGEKSMNRAKMIWTKDMHEEKHAAEIANSYTQKHCDDPKLKALGTESKLKQNYNEICSNVDGKAENGRKKIDDSAQASTAYRSHWRHRK